MSTVIVLGGGITGLSCAYYLRKLGQQLIKKVILIEQSTSLGGWMKSIRFPDGTVYEQGPRSFRVAGKSGQNTLELVEELGLASEILPVKSSDIAAKRRLIWMNNKLHVLPNTIMSIFKKQEPFNKPLISYLMKDLITKAQVNEDESVHNFGVRRFGKEVAEYLLDPMCRGIVAGDSRDISVRSLLNVAYKAEQEHGSVTKGMFFARESAGVQSSELVAIAKRNRWSLWSFMSGLQRLPESLSLTLGNDDAFQLRINTACKKLYFENEKALVHIEQDSVLKCDHVFSCLPARNLSRIVSMDQTSLAHNLTFIPSVHVAVVNLEFKGKVLSEQGFGYLVPSTQQSKNLGTIFDSSCFPEHDGHYDDKTRLTVMMGGSWFQTLFGDVDSADPEYLLQCAVESIAQQLNISAQPIRHHVSIQKNCIPHYKVGHHAVVSSVKKEIADQKLSLSVLGASFEGVSLNDCIYNSKLEVEKYLKSLTV